MGLELKNVTKKFKTIEGERVIFENLNIHFPDYGLIAITGESGCGKSTLLQLIAGLDQDYEGKILFNQVKIEDIKDYRQLVISFVYQNYQLIDYLSVKDNCLFYCHLKGIKVVEKQLQELLEIFELNKTVRMIQDFINEDLSNWYIRRSRRRFWATELTEDKKSVYNTTYEILTELCQLIAPFAPYISEEIYRNLTGEVSVHLSNYPKANLELINPELEEKMDLVKNLVTLGRASREATRIKVRQPIQKVLVDGKFKDTISDVVDLIKEELNVKEVVFAKDLGEYMNFSLKPNFKVLGPVLGAKMKFFAGALNKLNSNEVAPKLEVGETLTVDIDGENFEFNKDHVLVNISAKEGFNVSMENNLFVILDTTLTTELIEEGYAREFISKIQQIRKASNFDVLDNIDIDFCGDDEIAQAVENFKDYIKSETLALEINRVDDESLEKHNSNDHMTGIKVTRK
mgnify:CR=1 FL=1